MKKDVQTVFSGIEDPRVAGRCLHKLSDILFIALCALLANGEDYEDMVEFGNQRLEWLRNFVELPNGVPSVDTFKRVFRIIEPAHLGKCLREDAGGLLEELQGKLLSFDGKKLKGASPKSKGNHGLYILSAWAGEERLCIGQKKVQDKSNEITAIPDLLGELEIAGAVVSIDAIGCQTLIAKKIVDGQADYLLAVKENQKGLFEEVSEGFAYSPKGLFDETWEYEHGRYERRKCHILEAGKVLSSDMLAAWAGVKTVVKIEASRQLNGSSTSETRYYISSEADRAAAYYNATVRGHWGIENQLHWHLDVTFREDENRTRTGNAPQNLNLMRKMALHRLSKMPDKLSLKKRRFRASLNVQYLQEVLTIL